MIIFDAPDLFVRDHVRTIPGGLITPVVASSNWWAMSGHGTVTRLYSGLPLAYLPSAGNGQPLVSRVGEEPGDGFGLAWFIRRTTPEGKLWDSYSLAGPLGPAIKNRVESEPGWAVTRGYHWLCGPGLGDGCEGYVDYTLVSASEAAPVEDRLTTFVDIHTWLVGHRRVHGLLWTHQDGRTAKVLRRDMIAYIERNNP